MVSSNVEVVCLVCYDESVVVIVGEMVGKIYGFKIVVMVIEDCVDNIMCFLVIGCLLFLFLGNDCILLLVMVNDKFGVLYDVFSLFVRYGVSLNCIELCLVYIGKW